MAPARLRWLFLFTVLLPGVGLIGLTLHSVSEERALLEERGQSMAQDLAEAVRGGLRDELLADARRVDTKLRVLVATRADPAGVLAVTSDARVVDEGLSLVVPAAPFVDRQPFRPLPWLREALALEARGDPTGALAVVDALPAASAQRAEARTLRGRLLVRVDPKAALEFARALAADAELPVRARRIAALCALEAKADAAVATELLSQLVDAGGRGDSASATWFALSRLESAAGAIPSALRGRWVALSRLARVAADLSLLDVEEGADLEALDARFTIAPLGSWRRDTPLGGWLVLGPKLRAGDQTLRSALVVSWEALEARVAAAFTLRGGPDRGGFRVALAPSGGTPLGPGAALTVTALETATGQALARRRAEQRLGLLGGLLLLVVLGSLAIARSVRKSAELARLRTDFVASVTHELRTPVASIRAMAEVLALNKVDDPARRAEYFQGIAEETQRLGRLVDDVLDVSRIERGAFRVEAEPVAVGEAVLEIVERVRASVQSNGHSVVTELATNMPLCLLDRVLFGRALENLLVNAFKYAGEEKGVTVSGRREGAWVEVAVRDTGVGIPIAEQGRIFERFVRGATSQGRAGAGLGLAIVRTIAEEHGGSVSVESAPGQGSTFTLRLPVWEPEEAEA